MKYRKLFVPAAAALSLSLLLSGCGKTDLSSTREESAPVMVIDGYDVPYELYRYAALNHKDDYEAGLTETEAAELWLGEEGKARMAQLQEDTEDTLKFLYTTLSLAEDYGIDADGEIITYAVELAMEDIYAGYEEDMDAYLDSLAPYHMNDSVYRFLSRNQILTNDLYSAMLEAGDIETDEAVLAEMFRSDDFIRIRQILIAADNGNSAEENRAAAEAILDRLESGGDFEALLKEYGEDLFMFNNPDGYYMTRGNRHQAFEDAAFALEIGEYSDIVETEAGFSILLRCEKEEAYLEKHFDDLRQEYSNAAYNALLQAHMETLTAEALPALESYSIITMQ